MLSDQIHTIKHRIISLKVTLNRRWLTKRGLKDAVSDARSCADCRYADDMLPDLILFVLYPSSPEDTLSMPEEAIL